MSIMIVPAKTRPTMDLLSYYMRDVQRHPLMTPQEERERALEIVALRVDYWRSILSHAPVCDAIVDATLTLLPEGKDPSPLVQAKVAAQEIRRRDRKAVRDAFAAVVLDAAKFMAQVDQEGDIATPIVEDLCRLAEGSQAFLVQVTSLPRRDSRPFGAFLGRVRAAARSLLEARNRFARANLRLVVRMANKHLGLGLSLIDLVQEGNFGLLKAVDRFEPERGFRFSTYASWWIRHKIRRALADKSRIVRVPQHLHTLAQRAEKAKRHLRGELGRDPLVTELAAAINESAERITHAMRTVSALPVSLETSNDGEGRSLLDTLEAPGEEDPAEKMEAMKRIAKMLGRLRDLSPIEQAIIRQRFGLGGTEPRTLREIGEEAHLSRERIRQLQEGALRKMRTLMTEGA